MLTLANDQLDAQILCVTGLVLYLSVKFLEQLLWKIVIFSYCLYCFHSFVLFCFFFLTGSSGRECILVMWNLKAVIFSSIG